MILVVGISAVGILVGFELALVGGEGMVTGDWGLVMVLWDWVGGSGEVRFFFFLNGGVHMHCTSKDVLAGLIMRL